MRAIHPACLRGLICWICCAAFESRGVIEVPRELQVEPHLRLDSEKTLKAESRVRRHITLPVDKFIDARIRDAETLREFGLRQRQRLEKLLKQHLARMRRRSVRRNANHSALSDSRRW